MLVISCACTELDTISIPLLEAAEAASCGLFRFSRLALAPLLLAPRALGLLGPPDPGNSSLGLDLRHFLA